MLVWRGCAMRFNDNLPAVTSAPELQKFLDRLDTTA